MSDTNFEIEEKKPNLAKRAFDKLREYDSNSDALYLLSRTVLPTVVVVGALMILSR